MICPHGEHDLALPAYATNNADTYNKSCVTLTECCRKPVNVVPVRLFRVTPYVGSATEDDWGYAINKHNKPLDERANSD